MSAARHDGGRQHPLLRRGVKRDRFNQTCEHLRRDHMRMAEGISVRGFAACSFTPFIPEACKWPLFGNRKQDRSVPYLRALSEHAGN